MPWACSTTNNNAKNSWSKSQISYFFVRITRSLDIRVPVSETFCVVSVLDTLHLEAEERVAAGTFQAWWAGHARRPVAERTSPHRGVPGLKQTRKWEARIMVAGKSHRLGHFVEEEAANREYLMQRWLFIFVLISIFVFFYSLKFLGFS